jgi:hypothetical protein
MNEKITSLWQDYETHLFTCEHCQSQYLGKDLVHDFDASELVLPLDCPNCERRVALLNIQASKAQIKKFADQGYKTAIDYLKGRDRTIETWSDSKETAEPSNRHYESFPDFTVGDDENDAASRIANSIELLADTSLGQDAVQFMKMVAWGITNATEDSPYIVESENDESKYFQVIRGTEGEYYIEIASPEATGKEPDQSQREALEQLGWILPNEDSPNYHREYASQANRYDIAADAVKGWMRAYRS